MITKIIGTNFKGGNFEQPLARLNLLVGANGTGKSARIQALMLAVMGYIPGGAKKNQEIIDTYGSAWAMNVGVEIVNESGIALLSRGFVRSEAGAVSQKYTIDGAKAKEVDFQKALAMHGDPKIIDVSAFMDLSDQKKIDAIFALYPPAGNVNDIQNKIDALKEKLSVLTEKKTSCEVAAKRLISSKPTLPPGSLAEITGKIAEIEQQLTESREALSTAKAAEAARVAKEKAEKKAADDIKMLEEKHEKENKKAQLPEKGPMEKLVDEKFGTEQAPKYPCGDAESLLRMPGRTAPWVGSIQMIIDTMGKTGCNACAARLVAVRELKKYI